MACDAMSIPSLKFPRNKIIEVSPRIFLLHASNFKQILLTTRKIIPASYQNEAKRIHIPGLAPEAIPESPKDIKISVPLIGVVSPLTGLGTPAEPANSLHKD